MCLCPCLWANQDFTGAARGVRCAGAFLNRESQGGLMCAQLQDGPTWPLSTFAIARWRTIDNATGQHQKQLLGLYHRTDPVRHKVLWTWMHTYVDMYLHHKASGAFHTLTTVATGLLSLCPLSNRVRGSLLLLGWIVEQSLSSAWQDLSLEIYAETSAHAHEYTHTHKTYKWVIKRLPMGGKKMLKWFPSNQWCVLGPHEKWKIKTVCEWVLVCVCETEWKNKVQINSAH